MPAARMVRRRRRGGGLAAGGAPAAGSAGAGAAAGPLPGPAARSAAPAVPSGGNSPVERAGLGSGGAPQTPRSVSAKLTVWGGCAGDPQLPGRGKR